MELYKEFLNEWINRVDKIIDSKVYKNIYFKDGSFVEVSKKTRKIKNSFIKLCSAIEFELLSNSFLSKELKNGFIDSFLLYWNIYFKEIEIYEYFNINKDNESFFNSEKLQINLNKTSLTLSAAYNNFYYEIVDTLDSFIEYQKEDSDFYYDYSFFDFDLLFHSFYNYEILTA